MSLGKNLLATLSGENGGKSINFRPAGHPPMEKPKYWLSHRQRSGVTSSNQVFRCCRSQARPQTTCTCRSSVRRREQTGSLGVNTETFQTNHSFVNWFVGFFTLCRHNPPPPPFVGVWTVFMENWSFLHLEYTEVNTALNKHVGPREFYWFLIFLKLPITVWFFPERSKDAGF